MRLAKQAAAFISAPIVIVIGLKWRPHWVRRWGDWVGKTLLEDHL